MNFPPANRTTVLVAAVIVVLVGGAIALTVARNRYESKIASLQNQIAGQDHTIEVQNGLYEKLAQNLGDARSALDTSTAQGKELADQLKRDHEQLVQVTNVVIQLKDQVARGQGTVTTNVPEAPGETRVTFTQQFGLYHVYGSTLSPSGKYELHLDQTLPLKLGVALARDKTGAWHSLISSSDSDTKIDIGVTGIDESAFAPAWYEKLGVHLDLGAGPSGVLGGVGLLYKIGKFALGPTVWGVTDNSGAYYGLNLSWMPFERSR